MTYDYIEWEDRVYRVNLDARLSDRKAVEIWRPKRGWEPYHGDAARVMLEGFHRESPPEGVTR